MWSDVENFAGLVLGFQLRRRFFKENVRCGPDEQVPPKHGPDGQVPLKYRNTEGHACRAHRTEELKITNAMMNEELSPRETLPNGVSIFGKEKGTSQNGTQRLRAFLAGVMQGSMVEKGLVTQDYRHIIGSLLREHLPEVDLYDPLADHKNSLDYDRRTGRDVFFYHNKLCQTIDLLIAYLPQASMGTAIEMWEAYQHGAVVISISPMRHNWVVKFLSHRIYPDLEAFRAALETGEIRQLLLERRPGCEPHDG